MNEDSSVISEASLVGVSGTQEFPQEYLLNSAGQYVPVVAQPGAIVSGALSPSTEATVVPVSPNPSVLNQINPSIFYAIGGLIVGIFLVKVLK